MAHDRYETHFRHADHLAAAVRAETGKASFLLIATFMGGMLVLASFVALWVFRDASAFGGRAEQMRFHADLLALVGAVVLGAPLAWHAIGHLLKGHMHMDELVTVAIIAAISMGAYREAGVIAFFMLIATLIETRTALGARASIASLIHLTPTTAHVVDEEGHEREVEAASLQPGQIIRVRPGDNVPADGEIVAGSSTINQANITGESMPVDKAAGEEVFSGTTNLTGALDVRVTKAGRDTTLGRVQELILNAEATRIPLMRLIDRYAGWYTPTLLMLACIVLFFTREMERSISMLVVACPCALVLATPTAMVAALSAAARLGLLIKNVVDLEFARNLTAVVLDKTGTLTTGQLSVTRMMPAPSVDGVELLQVAATAEQLSKHPVARAVVDVSRKANLTLARPGEFKEIMGLGVEASLDGHAYRVGRPAWLREKGVDMSLMENPDYAEAEGISVLYVARDSQCLGWIGMEDRTREEARQALADLREQGIRKLVMVTGDRWSVARRVAAEMGCTDVQAEVLPAEKLALVDKLKADGHKVAVVGDGVNDAPALAAGDLGIAMGAVGSDVAINSASIALMNNDLSRLPFLIKLSKAATKVVYQNLIFGVLYIVTLLVLAGFGGLPAMLAAFLHTVASAIVIFNSARLVRFGEGLDAQRDRSNLRQRRGRVAASSSLPATAAAPA
jgi:Cd2+/Zn2+-exporting ATPase